MKGAITLMLIFTQVVSAQHYFSQETDPYRVTQVLRSSKDPFLFPWTGGMNSCQFGEVDMNMDGKKDLFVFDRHGDRILTFINGGLENTIDYSFSPEYISKFPDLFDWAILADYNMDGKEDIFTYAKDFPGIIVYKNTSQDELNFELEVFPFLTSLQGGGQVNILTTDVDYPGIADIDNDGDLDILTFWGLGSFIEYHQNQSMELYGIPDSLEYVEVTECWGYFAESDESNVIYLDTCMGNKDPLISNGIGSSYRDSRHTGSTFLLIDLDADVDLDLILGDVDYPNPIELVNGGTTDSAYMISQDPEFPSYNKPVDLFSMPAGAYIDLDNNGISDLLFSPFDPSLYTSANHRSVWYYKNSGLNNNPQFEFEQNNFLQEDMIDLGSGAYPVFADYDSDGLLDLFISNFGYYIYSFYEPGMFLKSVYWSNISLFRNSGTFSEPSFTEVTHDFENLHALHLSGLYPAFDDLDGDGDVDMISGRENGTLIFLENIAGPGSTMEFADPVFNFQNINVGEFSTPEFFDLNQDGLNDLIIGEKNGNLNYYRNTGSSSSPEYELITDSLGKINVTDFNFSYTGYSTPRLFKDMNDHFQMIVGSEQGKIFYFKDFEDNLTGAFQENDSLFVLVDEEPIEFDKGIRTSAVMAELNGDNFFELIVGNFSGGLNFYNGSAQPGVSGGNPYSSKNNNIHLYPNPAGDHIYISTRLNLSGKVVRITNVYGQVIHEEVADVRTRYRINLSSLGKGVYYVQVLSSGNDQLTAPAKFIKLN